MVEFKNVEELKEWMANRKREWLLKAIERDTEKLKTVTHAGARRILADSIEDYKGQLARLKK